MNKGPMMTIFVIFSILFIIFVVLAVFTRNLTLDVVYHPLDRRPEIKETPKDYGLVYEDVTTTTEDGLQLFGWFIPGDNGATIMIQHGTPGGRQDGLYEADVLNKAGYSVLLGSFRAHDECDGELITFGFHEQKDMAAWYQLVINEKGVDPKRIGFYGESMGGGTSILYAAKENGAAALATGSGFALALDTIKAFIKYETGFPDWLVSSLARLFIFWAEREFGFGTDALDTEAAIAQISPVPILIIHGGRDSKIGPDSGQRLFNAAAEPKELLLMEEAGHVDFEHHRPEEYQKALVEFFSQYLLDQ
jgi:fermentation-respiration switch protein FrsA (DUF1100 family)